MKTYPVTLPEMAIVALTRGMAGAGLGLLLSGSMQRETTAHTGLDAVCAGRGIHGADPVRLAWKQETGRN